MNIRFLIAATAIFMSSIATISYAEHSSKHSDALADFIEQQKLVLPAQFNFNQTRTIHGLPRPLQSSGQLIITEAAIDWKTTEPIQQHLVITADGIVEQDTEENIRGSEVVATLLLAVMRGDKAQVEENFDYHLKPVNEENTQCIELTPRNSTIARFIQRIESCGTPTLDTITLIEQGGNRSVIELEPVSQVTQ